MFCPKCGAQVPDGSPFCSSCGAQMGAQQPQQPANQNFAANFNSQVGNAFKSTDLNPKNMINDFVAFFKKPSATIQQIIAWAGALLLFISTFLPHHSESLRGVKLFSYNLWTGRGFFYWLFFLIFILATLFFATIKRDICVLSVGAACVLWSLLDIITTKSKLSGTEKILVGNYYELSKGVGCWLILVSSLVILAAGIWGFLESKKKKA